MKPRYRYSTIVLLLSAYAGLVPVARSQILDFGRDNVLQAPYRGTVDSLREATLDLGYGEVMTHVEPITGALLIESQYVAIWADEAWDRSVLRLYNGLDASGPEIDLTGKTENDPAWAVVDSEGFKRFSFKAIATKTTAITKFRITFRYTIGGGEHEFQSVIRVAPMTGSFTPVPGEREAFHLGTPVLEVSVGAVGLVVPIGRSALTLGAAYAVKQNPYGPFEVSSIDRTEMLHPGSAATVFVQHMKQFRLGSTVGGPRKSLYGYGTPWGGYLAGHWTGGNALAPDGALFILGPPDLDHIARVNRIEQPAEGSGSDSTITYEYPYPDWLGPERIRDGAGNHIEFSRDGSFCVYHIQTSDGRGWDILSDDTHNMITGIVPDPGGQQPNGLTRFYEYVHGTDSADGYEVARVRKVFDASGQQMYQFNYAVDDNELPTVLEAEQHWIDEEGGLRTVVQHVLEPDPGGAQRYEYTDTAEYRKFELSYDSANGFPNRLASVTAYENLNGGGTEYVTTYTNATTGPAADRGNFVLTQVELPNGTTIDYEYDSSADVPQEQRGKFGFRTQATLNGQSELVVLDTDYSFLWDDYGTERLFYNPRVIKQRDGRGQEVTLEYISPEDDTPVGARTTRLYRRFGPTINEGYSVPRTPEVKFTYTQYNSTLVERIETKYGSGGNDYRVVEFEYDTLRRVERRTVDPAGLDITTHFLYCDTEPTQARIVIDPDSYCRRTLHNYDRQVISEVGYLDAGAYGPGDPPCGVPTGDYYQTEYQYDVDGRLEYEIVDNKDQSGNPLMPPTITTSYTHDRLGRLTLREVDPGGVGQQEHTDYNWLNQVEREYDTSGRGVKRVFDGRGLVDEEIPLAENEQEVPGLTISFTYDANGRLRFIDRPTGAQDETVYDDFGRTWKQIRHPGPDGGTTITTELEYDDASNVTRQSVYEDDSRTIYDLSDVTHKYDEGSFRYESRQRLAAGTDSPEDPLTQRKFGWAGNVTEQKPLGDNTVADCVITYEYDGASRVERVTNAEGGETWFEQRDGRGNITEQWVKLTDTDYAVTNTVYDALSRAVQITDPEDDVVGGDRHYRERYHDSRANLLRETAHTASGTPKQTTIFKYDSANGLEYRALLADAERTTLAGRDVDRVVDSEYDADGRLHFRTSYNNNVSTPLVTETTYDSLGRVDVVTDPSGSFTDDEYATNGRLDQRAVNDGFGDRVFTFGYDGHDRITSRTAVGDDPIPDLVTSYEHDGLDRAVRVTSPKAITTRADYDLTGQRIAVVENEGGGVLERTTAYNYNRLNQLITQTAQNKAYDGTPLSDQVPHYRYDSLGRLLRTVYPDSTADPDDPDCVDCVRMQYDLAGRRTYRHDQRGLETSYVYDDRGMLLSRTTGTDVDAIGYDALGRMLTADRGTTEVARDYTDLGDLDYETQIVTGGAARTVDYGYDQAGNRLELTYPGGVLLTYTPTVLNQVASMTFGSQSVTYVYYGGGRLPFRRATTTTAVDTTYYVLWNYDSHRRVSQVRNSLVVGMKVMPLATHTYTHDNNGNPLTQTATDDPLFAGDDRVFTVDDLDRLVGTDYAEFNVPEQARLDLLGNRESFEERTGVSSAYSVVNAANEYSTIDGTAVEYDQAGNLTVDEDGRQYFYDEQNRLTEVRDAGELVLAGYTYDALGRRVMAEFDPDDPPNAVTIRYYYDGQSVIEERDAADALVRYHINGGQYIDEQVASCNVGANWLDEEFTYYLLSDNYSVIGAGNADGGQIERLHYGSGGSFPCQPCNDCEHPTTCAGDVDGDQCVGMSDLGALLAAWGTNFGEPLYNGCADLDCDGTIGPSDLGILLAHWEECCAGEPCPPPASGTFVLHGRAVDVLPDGKVLLYVRARYYDPQHGRWLQRDPSGYADGNNLYESFGSNTVRFVDPSGRWMARRIAEILQEKGQINVGDIQQLAKELHSSPRSQITKLTEEEIALLSLIGGPAHGTPWTEANLSADLKKRADDEFAGLAAPYRYRAEATYATRRRMLWMLLFRNQAFSQYVTDLYRVSRDLNPLHFAFERGWQVGSGQETVTGEKVSRVRAGAEFVVYLALLKGAQVAPRAITKAAGGEVPGGAFAARAAPVKGRTVRVYRVEAKPNARIAIDEQGGVAILDESRMLFLNFGSRARADAFFAQKLQQGLPGAQIKSFEVPRSFLQQLRATAVAQRHGRLFPDRPQAVDVTKAPDQFGLRPEQIKALQDAVIQGTGQVKP